MSTILDNAILETENQIEKFEMDENGELIDYVAGLTDAMVEAEPDYTEDDIDDDVKEMVEEED